MSLIIAVIGSREAIIGGDRRRITFLGSCFDLEQELYSGELKTDEDLLKRAKELGASLQVADGKEKVWLQGDILVGEVTEVSAESCRIILVWSRPSWPRQAAGHHQSANSIAFSQRMNASLTQWRQYFALSRRTPC